MEETKAVYIQANGKLVPYDMDLVAKLWDEGAPYAIIFSDGQTTWFNYPKQDV